MSSAARFLKEHCFLDGFQASPIYPAGKDQHVDEDECGAMVEWYRQGKTEIVGKKTVRVSTHSPQITHGLT